MRANRLIANMCTEWPRWLDLGAKLRKIGFLSMHCMDAALTGLTEKREIAACFPWLNGRLI